MIGLSDSETSGRGGRSAAKILKIDFRESTAHLIRRRASHESWIDYTQTVRAYHVSLGTQPGLYAVTSLRSARILQWTEKIRGRRASLTGQQARQRADVSSRQDLREPGIYHVAVWRDRASETLNNIVAHEAKLRLSRCHGRQYSAADLIGIWTYTVLLPRIYYTLAETGDYSVGIAQRSLYADAIR